MKDKKTKQNTLSQIKKKRKRKGVDLEAPEVITFQGYDIFGGISSVRFSADDCDDGDH